MSKGEEELEVEEKEWRIVLRLGRGTSREMWVIPSAQRLVWVRPDSYSKGHSPCRTSLPSPRLLMPCAGVCKLPTSAGSWKKQESSRKTRKFHIQIDKWPVTHELLDKLFTIIIL